MSQLWNKQNVQFARLISEIMATQDNLDLVTLASSMDLDLDDVRVLFDRANECWEQHKEALRTNTPATDDKLTIDVAIYDEEGSKVDTTSAEVTLNDVSEVFSLASELVLIERSGKRRSGDTEDVKRRLEHALEACDFIGTVEEGMQQRGQNIVVDAMKIQTYLRRQIEDGHIAAEDIPERLTTYGLMNPQDFADEMAERIELDSADQDLTQILDDNDYQRAAEIGDLDAALSVIQDQIGVTTGDCAAVFCSGHAVAQREIWPNASVGIRKMALIDYVAFEQLHGDHAHERE